MRWWLRSLAIGGGIGLASGFVIGGILGRIYMRLLFLVEEETKGFETDFGAIVGDVTADGTFFIFVFGGMLGASLGLSYVALRALMPPGIWWRELIFVGGSTAALLPFIVRQNLDDFSFLPVTLSLAFIVASIALSAVPVPFLVERFAPDRVRYPSRLSYAALGLVLTVAAVNAALAVSSAYAVESQL